MSANPPGCGKLRPMSFDAAIARISQLQAMIDPSLRASAVGGAAAPQAAPAPADFSAALAQQMLTQTPPAAGGNVALLPGVSVLRSPAAAPLTTAASASSTVGERMVALAQQELARNVVEDPPGSNESPDIARYRTATQGAMGGQPWCAYFTSYIAKQAGVPIGDYGQGMGLVDNITDWAQRTGKFIPTSGQPLPGDLALFDEHIGIVESVKPDGNITLIEGNSSDRVQRVDRNLSELVGFARLG